MISSIEISGKKHCLSAFRDAVDQNCKDMESKQLGENGCPEYTNAGVGSNILALSQIVRNGDPELLTKEVLETGTSNDVADLVLLLFVIRNCRGGKGEKKLSHDMFLRFWVMYPETGKKLVSFFPEYGYWKDLLLLMLEAKEKEWFDQFEELAAESVAVMRERYLQDLSALYRYNYELKNETDGNKIKDLKKKGPNISLLAKWLPREGSSFDKKLDFVRRFTGRQEVMASSEDGERERSPWQCNLKAKYRHQVAQLTSFLDLPEVSLAARKEEEVKFGRVAAKATLNLRNVFMNQTEDGKVRSPNLKRIRLAERFKEHVINIGLKGAQLMPHDIVQKILDNHNISKMEELVLDAQWKSLWKNVIKQVEAKAAEDGMDFSPTQMVPLCDVSASMHGMPMVVAIALSIGISEITHDAFRDLILTFESKPRWHCLKPGDTIVQKVRSLRKAPWGGSTNFEAAFDLILKVVRDRCLTKEEMPSLIIFSDMQFNEAAGTYSRRDGAMETMHQNICGKVRQVAKELQWEDDSMPPMIYWNLRNTESHPVDKDTGNTVLLAGFSPSLLKLIMQGEALREEEVEIVQNDGTIVTKHVQITPEQILRKMLDDKLYDPVREVLLSSREGKLLEYEIPLPGSIRSDGMVLT